MDRPDRGDARHVGGRQRRELGDLARAAHAHLDHGDLGALGEPHQRHRHADLGVAVARRALRRDAGRAQHRDEDVLRGRLARGPGDPDDARAAALERQAPRRLEHGRRVGRDDHRPAHARGSRPRSTARPPRPPPPPRRRRAGRRARAGRRRRPRRGRPRRGPREATSRESTDAPSTSVSGLPTGSRASAADLRMSLTVSLTRPPLPRRRRRAPRGRRRGRRTASPPRCAPAPARAPCRRSRRRRRRRPRRPPRRSPPAGPARRRPAPPTPAPARICVDDRLGILGARVVGGDHRDVGERPGGPAHLGPLAAVAVAAAAEDARRGGPRPRARGRRAARSRASPACARSRPAPGRAARRRSPRSGRARPAMAAMPAADRLVGQAEQLADGDHAGEVGEVEAAAQPALDVHRPPGRGDAGRDAGGEPARPRSGRTRPSRVDGVARGRRSQRPGGARTRRPGWRPRAGRPPPPAGAANRPRLAR